MKSIKKICLLISTILLFGLFIPNISASASAADDELSNKQLYDLTNTYEYGYNEDENGINEDINDYTTYNNDYRYDFSKPTNIPVNTGNANITVLTHGLNGTASHWSNDGNGNFAYDENSIINRLYNLYNEVNVYLLKFKEINNFELIDLTTQINSNLDNTNFDTKGNEVNSIVDISKHIIIIFEAYEYNEEKNVDLSSNDDIYSQFNYGISNIVYQYKQLNNGVLPRINLIGHSRGGITNMQYALDHPDLIDSIYSIGTPYCGSTTASIDALWLHIFSDAKGKDDIIDEKIYTNYMNNWNNHYYEYNYDDINVLAIGGRSTLKFLGKMLESDSSKDMLIDEGFPLELIEILPSIIYLMSDLITSAVIMDMQNDNITGKIQEITSIILETVAIWNDLSSKYIYDIVRFLCNELDTSIIPPTTLVLNDIFVNLNSQLGIYNGSIENSSYLGYYGFNTKVRTFTEFDADINNSAVNSMSIPHNLEPKDDLILTQIINDINVEQFDNTSRFETYYVSENEVGILSYLGTNGTNQLTIPSIIDGKTVVEIGTHAFSDNSSVFNVTLPNTIKSINNSAFENCTNLTNVDTSNATSLTSIGTNAFLNCSSLTSFTIPTNLNSLGTSTFLGSGIKIINNNSSYFELANNTLYTLGKTQLIFSPRIYQLTVPTTVDYIWPNAFSNNEQLTTINLSNVENIGKDAFSGCINLTNIYNSSGSLIYADKKTFVDTPWFKNRGDVTILGSVLLDYKGLSTSYEIPSSVSYIALGAFESSTLTEVYIGNNIKTIGEYAFINCQSLDKIYFTKVVYASLYHTSFPMNAEIFVPESNINHYLNDEECSLYTISTYPIKVNYYINDELYLTSVVNFYGKIPDIGVGLKGYTFEGWLYNDKLYKTGSLMDTFANEIDLEAKFIANTYNVDLGVYHRLKATFGMYLPSSSAHIVEQDGKMFMGWYTKEGVCYINDMGKATRFWDIDEDTILKGIWEPITYYISYDLNGGEHTSTSYIMVQTHSQYTVKTKTFTLANPTRFGYEFAGWECDGNIITEIAEGTFGNLSLKATWHGDKVSISTTTRDLQIPYAHAILELPSNPFGSFCCITVGSGVKSLYIYGNSNIIYKIAIDLNGVSRDFELYIKDVTLQAPSSYNCIYYTNSYKLNMYIKGTVNIYGANGTNGSNGSDGQDDSSMMLDDINGNKGGNGTNGTCGIYCYKLTLSILDGSTLTIKGGNGGRGGDGGNGGHGIDGPKAPSGSFTNPIPGDNGGDGGSGGDGGNGGHGGYAIYVMSSIFISGNSYSLIGGDGGHGGAGGDGGNGGKGASDTSTNIFNGVGDPGNGGNGGDGGDGGYGGDGQKGLNVSTYSSTSGYAASGGSGGYGGSAGAGGSAGSSGENGTNGINGQNGDDGQDGIRL